MRRSRRLEQTAFEPDALYAVDENGRTIRVPDQQVLYEGQLFPYDPFTNQVEIPVDLANRTAIDEQPDINGDFTLNIERREGTLAITAVGEQGPLLATLGSLMGGNQHIPQTRTTTPSYPSALTSSVEDTQYTGHQNRTESRRNIDSESGHPVVKRMAQIVVPFVVICGVASQSSWVGGDDRSVQGMVHNVDKFADFAGGVIKRIT